MGNDSWPAHLVRARLLLCERRHRGNRRSGPLVRRTHWRYVLPATAVLGALAPLRLVVGSGVRGLDGRPTTAVRGRCRGAARASLGMTAATALPHLGEASGRSMPIWAGWIWLNVAGTVLTYTHHDPAGTTPCRCSRSEVLLWAGRRTTKRAPCSRCYPRWRWRRCSAGGRSDGVNAPYCSGRSPALLVAAHLTLPVLFGGTTMAAATNSPVASAHGSWRCCSGSERQCSASAPRRSDAQRSTTRRPPWSR